MYKLCSLLFGVLLFASLAVAEEDPIHEDWVAEDVKFVAALTKAYQQHPLNIVPLLEVEGTSFLGKINLGYGYARADSRTRQGYTVIFYDVIYVNDQPIAYRLRTWLPDEPQLRQRYRELYRSMFEIEEDEIKPLYYNRDFVSAPLHNCDVEPGLEISPAVEKYMSPFSGIIYGERGGITNDLIANRAAFLSLRDSLTPKLFHYLLCSKNPATRFTAAEYFYALEDSGEKLPSNIAWRLEQNFLEVPEALTMGGCVMDLRDSRQLVDRYTAKITDPAED